MKNKELQEILRAFPDETDIKLYIHPRPNSFPDSLKDFDEENITDYAPDDKIDEETDEVIKGELPRVIVINPPVL